MIMWLIVSSLLGFEPWVTDSTFYDYNRYAKHSSLNASVLDHPNGVELISHDWLGL